MLSALKIFFGAKRVNRPLVILCLILGGLAEGLGLATLLPVLSVIQGNTTEEDSLINEVVFSLLRAFGQEPSIGSLLLLVAVAITVKAGLYFLAMLRVSYAVAEVTTEARQKIISKLLKVRWSYFASQPTGRFANAISAESLRTGMAFLQAATLVSMAFQTLVYIIVAMLVSWKLGLASILFGALIAGSLSGFVTMARKAGKRHTQRTRELVSHLTDALTGIKSLKAMARQDHLQRFYNVRIQKLKTALRREAISNKAIRSLQEPMIVLVLCGGFYIAVTQSDTPLSELLVLMLLVERTVTSIGRVQNQLGKTSVQTSAHESVRAIIKEASEQKELRLGDKVPTLQSDISFRDVSFSYEEKKVLNHANLKILAEKLTVLTGPSGVGKTTLTDLILGLRLPDEGEVLIDGVSLSEIDHRKWRGMVGYVPQELFLFHQSIFENVRLSDEALSEQDVIDALKQADAWRFVENLPQGIHTVVGERGSKFSGGQRQRIALARALVHKPQLLILDEATSALDPESEIEICQNVRRLSGSLTIISITHKPAWLTHADMVYELTPQGIYQLPVTSSDAAK